MSKIRFFDIDNTICQTNGTDYETAAPIAERIKKINALYRAGDRIVYWTARGALLGRSWTEMTKQQLYNWGCKYHELRVDKPLYDTFVDDRNFNADVLDDLKIWEKIVK
jgi:histidinol phosphatase-like enzyme